MNFTLHPFQESALAARNSVAPVPYYLIASPTGTGKSYMILAIRERIPDSWVITPRVEIIRGLLTKLGYHADTYTLDQLIECAWKLRITTPMRLRNRMLAGEFLEKISLLLWDEVHHHLAETWQLLDLMSGCPSVGFTATPFRGTPRDTAKFLERWGTPHWAITYPDAVRQGYIRMPSLRIEPLIDDDVVSIVNGEFEIESLESETENRLDDIATLIVGCCVETVPPHRLPDVPTMVSLPSSKLITALQEQLKLKGVNCVRVTQETRPQARVAAFRECLDGTSVLPQIDVVSEGVDLPIKRLIDLRPTMSPVKWLQQLGRITQPGEPEPEYICCNRNLLRHAYLLEGLIPQGKLIEAQESFPPSARATGIRAIGLEAVGRFKPVTIRLKSGLELCFYSVTAIDNGRKIDYAIMLHPGIAKPLIARRVMPKDLWDRILRGEKIKIPWEQFHGSLTELTGFQSVTPKSISEKQRAWWERSAGSFGLDPAQKINAKSFQILPVLSDIRKVIV